MKSIFLMGATGSVGEQTLEVLASYPQRFSLYGFSFFSQLEKAREIIHRFSPVLVVAGEEESAECLKKEFPTIRILTGENGLEEAAVSNYNFFVNAITGSRGLLPTLAAIRKKKEIALANKETLVMAGDFIMSEAKKYGVTILPLDSEHSAIFQVMQGISAPSQIRKMVITASGGSFRDVTRAELSSVTKEAALTHPNWSMGEKITIDSSSMVNKGLEVIEAHHLFGISYDQIEVILHRESVVHSMIELADGAILAQLGASDMRQPIQYALTYPEHLPIKEETAFSLVDLAQLHFAPMDYERFPMLALAFYVGKRGGTFPAVYNAANELAVEAFLNEKISYLQIEDVIKKAVSEHVEVEKLTLENILTVDQKTREKVERWLTCPQEL
ncbi:1-deoxy-D-xylulose 5-phosphate reductoisomerase [Streptococcus sp. DD10]|uniref:1-deoxy-D-xylulose-5-phosphate reductoisomerase n=1 Tax=Streptococcus sp. DD10 TaxID=1777878 RepID=UPI000796CD70|nr:1-deoxy-D-xylulose-5-phosphate reductoisomerase [Streptococcus sp. DD10]KXT72199.1 1-deoxy-D-xylulose 5-phosphate reductoisomerase [Streptococcus sp. DD10]